MVHIRESIECKNGKYAMCDFIWFAGPELSVGPFCVTRPNPIQLTMELTV